MKNVYIELTDTDDVKILFNVLHIAWIEPGKNGTVLKSNLVNYSIPKKVKESYDEIKSMIMALNS
ncbi:MAG TPA: hypothetical protein VMT63_02620 [Bacteroidales bacterium]|nr:hypothetical protein [Bacteroidales bacterium]